MKRLAFALAILAAPVAAHEAPSGWQYDYRCCGSMDCAPVAAPRREGGMLVFRIRAGTHPMVRQQDEEFRLAADDLRIEPSGDANWHLCIRPWGEPEIRIICAYRPPVGF